jgi:hypothetical protein
MAFITGPPNARVASGGGSTVPNAPFQGRQGALIASIDEGEARRAKDTPLRRRCNPRDRAPGSFAWCGPLSVWGVLRFAEPGLLRCGLYRCPVWSLWSAMIIRPEVMLQEVLHSVDAGETVISANDTAPCL